MTDGNRSGGCGFIGLLAILLIGLKLTHQIDWSWWTVLAPLWVPFAVFVVITSVSLACNAILRKLETPQERKSRELQEALRGMSKAIERRKH